MVKQVLVTPALLICTSVFGCKNSITNLPIQFVERNAVSSYTITPQPLVLIVEIDDAGRLRLNKIDTGTTRDMSLLAEKLEVIFDDREKTGINERGVLIDPSIDPDSEDIEELVRTLADVKASPITIIRNGP